MIDNELNEQPKLSHEILEIPQENLVEEQAQQVETARETQPVTETRSTSPEVQQSWRDLREAKSRAERERDEAYRMMQEMAQKQKAPVEPEEDLNFNIDPDALAEGKHLSKVDKKIRKLQQELQTYKQQTAEQVMEAKLKATYPDFDKVVNDQTVAALREQYPEIVNTLNTSQDLYSKAVSAYTMIKKFGISKEDVYQDDRERVQKNAAKPKPSITVSPQTGDSPLARANAFANGLTDELKNQLRKEMEDARRNR